MEILHESDHHGLLKTGELLKKIAGSNERQLKGWHNLGSEVVAQLFGSDAGLSNQTQLLISALGFIVEKIGLSDKEPTSLRSGF